MGWKDAVNAGLRRTTGLQLTRAKVLTAPRGTPETRAGDRLLERPAFILSSVRSGSTLLRVLLDSHSQLHAPHELHLRDLAVTVKDGPATKAMEELALDAEHLEYLLWDRLLHREVVQAGKRRVVNKTPTDVFVAERICRCWPDFRFLFLLRHPASIARSRAEARPQDSEEHNVRAIRRYADALERARQTYPGLVVRYEELTSDPEATLRRICEFLEVEFEPQMLAYDQFDHGRYKVGLGDWTEKIRSGVIHPPEPVPEHVPDGLRSLCEAWGYPPGQAALPQR
ncbi:MAG: sulfotransferase family protein [Solirubrobacteraceae bacterium]